MRKRAGQSWACAPFLAPQIQPAPLRPYLSAPAPKRYPFSAARMRPPHKRSLAAPLSSMAESLWFMRQSSASITLIHTC